MDRIAEEVKAALKPHFAKNLINKDEYKDIMRRAVPKVSIDCGRWLVRIVAGPNHPSFQDCPENLCGHVPDFLILCLVFIILSHICHVSLYIVYNTVCKSFELQYHTTGYWHLVRNTCQAIGPAVANACLPKLVRVLGTIRSLTVAERRWRRVSIMLTWLTKFDRYAGAFLCSDLYTACLN